MLPEAAAERLLRAEAELRAARLAHDSTNRAAERYREARREVEVAEAIAVAVLQADLAQDVEEA